MPDSPRKPDGRPRYLMTDDYVQETAALGHCFECGEILAMTGRLTAYCPACDTCPDCGCPRADNFEHYADCPAKTE